MPLFQWIQACSDQQPRHLFLRYLLTHEVRWTSCVVSPISWSSTRQRWVTHQFPGTQESDGKTFRDFQQWHLNLKDCCMPQISPSRKCWRRAGSLWTDRARRCPTCDLSPLSTLGLPTRLVASRQPVKQMAWVECVCVDNSFQTVFLCWRT